MALVTRITGARILVLLSASLLAGGMYRAAHAGWERIGLGESWARIEEEMARSRRLDRITERLLPRLLLKQRISRRVAAGRMTLFEAAAHFRDIARQFPEFNWSAFRAAHPGASDDERHCHAVIAFVHGELGEDGSFAEATHDQLRQQLADRLRSGPIRLPEIAEAPADFGNDPE